MNPSKRNTLNWIAITLVLFPVLIIFGIIMRTVQGNALHSAEGWFYPLMTVHGLGMAGVWFVGAMACTERVISKYTSPSYRVSKFAQVGTVVGVLLLLVSVFIGRFAAGWYFLYPLPMKGNWPSWATMVFLISITVLGASWLIWCLDLMRAIAQRYPLTKAFGWHLIAGKTDPVVPPAIMITTVSLVATIACLLAGVVTLVLYYIEIFFGVPNDALLVKNLTFFFGHLLVNLSLYLGVGAIYDVLPEYADRPWKNNRVVAIAWNTVLAVVLLAYFHHLYMDFVQPRALQYIGQIASYASSLPSAIVTIFGAFLLIYRAKMRWTLASSLLFFSLMGWSIGGMGAVIDSTIAVNSKFHNTLWVPAHFHTYMIEGLVLMVLGYFYHYVQGLTKMPESTGWHKTIFVTLLISGYGFLLMFYIGGMNSIPRRYALYPSELTYGATYALIAAGFATLFLIALIFYIVEIYKRWSHARV